MFVFTVDRSLYHPDGIRSHKWYGQVRFRLPTFPGVPTPRAGHPHLVGYPAHATLKDAILHYGLWDLNGPLRFFWVTEPHGGTVWHNGTCQAQSWEVIREVKQEDIEAAVGHYLGPSDLAGWVHCWRKILCRPERYNPAAIVDSLQRALRVPGSSDGPVLLWEFARRYRYTQDPSDPALKVPEGPPHEARSLWAQGDPYIAAMLDRAAAPKDTVPWPLTAALRDAYAHGLTEFHYVSPNVWAWTTEDPLVPTPEPPHRAPASTGGS